VKLSILQVTPQLDVGGAETMVTELVRGLTTRAHQVHILTRPGVLAEQLPADVTLTAVQHTGKATAFLRFVAGIRRVLKNSHVDVINAHSVVTAVAARLAAPGIPVVGTVHGLRDATYRMSGVLLSALVTMIAPVSRKTAEALCVSPVKTRVIWTGIPRSTEPPYLKESLGIRPNALILGSVARLSAEKGIDHLLRIFSAVTQRDDSAILIIVGGGPERPRLEAMARELRVDGRVLFLGERGDVQRILPLFDVFLLPSRREGIPRAALEALFEGVPVVAANVGGLPEVAEVTQGITLLDSYDPGVWLSAIREVMNRRQQPWSNSGLLQRFGADRMVEEYLDLYQSLVR